MQVSLLELQQSFHHAICSRSADGVLPWIANVRAAERVAIYRNNSQTNLRNALRSDYPVVEKLVGSEFFAHATDAYIAATPSLSGDVGEYGDGFADFLATFPPATSLPYLGDVARMERAWRDVFLAAEKDPIEISTILVLAEKQLGAIRFEFNPCVGLIESAYPVLTIWRANQMVVIEGSLISVDSNEEFVLLRRIDSNVELSLMDRGEYEWLSRLRSGSSLNEAVEAAFVAQPEFKLMQCLHRHLAAGTFISFTTGEQS